MVIAGTDFRRSGSGLYVPRHGFRPYSEEEARQCFGVSISVRVDGAGVASLGDPLTILGATNTKFWIRSDLGITLNGSTVSAWADQSGGGFHITQGTAANQPTYEATGGPTGGPCVTADGTSDYLQNTTFDFPAPGTTPWFFGGVLRVNTYGAFDRILNLGAAATGCLLLNNASPTLIGFNGTLANSNGGLAVGAWGRFENYYSNSASDYLKLKSTTVTGTSAGNTDPAAGLTLFNDFSGAAGNAAACSIVEVYIANILPSAAQLTALDTYFAARYGSGVLA